jgi:hypothetical protein
MDATTPDEPKPKSAIEIAREFGVDIEHIRYLRRLSPMEHLRLMESSLDFIVAAREAMKRQKRVASGGKTKYEERGPGE